MRTKYGKFYSDWRDRHGVRRTKAHHTEIAAIRHNKAMRKKVAAELRRDARKQQHEAQVYRFRPGVKYTLELKGTVLTITETPAASAPPDDRETLAPSNAASAC